MKSDEISRSFMETPAYEVLFEKLVTDDKCAADFVNAVMRSKSNPVAPTVAPMAIN